MMMSWVAASKRSIVIAAAVTALVTGCAHRERGRRGQRRPSPT
jgi:hypothetical protein